MADLLNTIKKAAVGAVGAGNPMAFMFGQVSSIDPLEVIVDQRFTLPAAFLVIPESFSEYEALIDEQKVIIKRELKLGDKLLLLRVQGGQQYVIFDRLVRP